MRIGHLRKIAVLLLLILCSQIILSQGKSTGGAAAPAPAAPSSSAAFESQMLAYGGLNLVADEIANRVCAVSDIGDTGSIVIFDQAAFASIQSYVSFVANEKLATKTYETLLSNPVQARRNLKDLYHQRAQAAQSEAGDRALAQAWSRKEQLMEATGPAFGDPISDTATLLSAFAVSSNVESPGTIAIPDAALAVALTRSLKAHDKCNELNIMYPPLFGSGAPTDTSTVDIDTDIQQVIDMREAAYKDIESRNQAFMVAHPSSPATPAIPAAGSTPAVPAKPQTDGASDSVLTAEVADINSLFDSFMNSLLQVNQSTGSIGGTSVIQGRRIAGVVSGQNDKKPAYVLLATIVAAGGTTHDHKTFWTNLTSGDRFTYSGGEVVSFALWKVNQRSPFLVDVIRYRSPLMEVGRPSTIRGVEEGSTF